AIGAENDVLLDPRVEDGRLVPAELLLAPGAEVLRPAAADLVGHRAPLPHPLRARLLRPGVEVRQPEHVPELVAEHADVVHPLPALLDDEVRQRPPTVADARPVRPG